MASHVPLYMGMQGATVADPVREHFFVPAVNTAMRALERVMANIALTEIPMLLIGESGTGKEEVAVFITFPGSRTNPSSR